MDWEGLLLFNCSRELGREHRRWGRGGCRTMFPKVVFLGAPENSLGKKASEIFANIQQGDK